jgi:hypothetical protein
MERRNYIGTDIMWGEIPADELPKLPDGWRFEVRKDCWLLAVSPKGDIYYVSTTKLYPRRQRKETGTFFIDTREGIIELKHDTTQQQQG